MTALDSPSPAGPSRLPLIGAFVTLIVVVALVASALALRYGGPSGSAVAEAACVDSASPMATFDVEQSFSVDEVAQKDAADLDGWQAIAKNVEALSEPDDSVETFWVVGVVDDLDAVCIADYVEGELLVEPQFVEASAFDQYK